MLKTLPDSFADIGSTAPEVAASREQTRSSGPVRSCAACRARVSRDVLLRFVIESGEAQSSEEGAEPDPSGKPAPDRRSIVVDLARTHPGRGVNVGPSPVCIERAVKRGAFQRQWRMQLSRDGVELLQVQTRESLRERLAAYIASAWARGGLVEVASVDEIEPREAKVLWESEDLVELVTGIPPARATNPRISAKIKALTSAVSEFTFTRVGGTKRRPEAPEACEALERCGGGAIRGVLGVSAMTRRKRVGAGPSLSGPDGRNG